MDNDIFTPALTTTDWNREWKQLQQARRHADDAAAWDKRARTFPVKHGSQAGYVERFLELAGIQPGESVLDMGCGTGALATPLARDGHPVIACDFSRGMLDVMAADQRELGVTGVDVRLLSWDDDWDAHGLGADCVDVALASRSIATRDLGAALEKLSRVARRRACITLPCGPSPKIDEQLLAAAGLEARLGRDFVYAFNILASRGINPEIAYIPSTRREVFETFSEACSTYADIVVDAARPFTDADERAAIPARLEAWLSAHLAHDETGWHLAQERRVTWAFLAWSTKA